MKGFGIYVKNNLLEPKHIENMDAAVWLYLWLLDKMTSVNENGIGKVMAGKPISYEFAATELGVSRQVYVRWVAKLRDHGYIKTLRTPYGLVFTVLKAEKIFGNRARSIKSDTTGSIKKDTSTAKRSIKTNTSDVSKSIHKMRQKRASNNNNTNNNTVTTTNVGASGLDPLPSYGKPEINELFEFWAQEVGYNIESRVKQNRAAASNLLKKHGKDKLHQLIRGVALTQSDQYAPHIADFAQLQQKVNDLLVWGRKKHGSGSVTVIS